MKLAKDPYFVIFIVGSVSVASAAKLATMMPSNTFIQNSETPTSVGRFIVWNDQSWHYGDNNKLRVWQHSTQTWKDVTENVFGAIPSLRTNAGFAVASDRFFLYGGLDANKNLISQSDNFYSFDPARSFAWSKLENKIGETVPYVRRDFGFVGIGNKAYLFGGLANWPLNCPAEANCDASGCLLVFEGKNQRCLLNDLYEYNPDTEVWQALFQPGGQKPCERMEFGFTAGNGKLFVLGGTTLQSNVPGSIAMAAYNTINSCGSSEVKSALYRIQDLWSYDPELNSWTALAPPNLDVGILPGLAFHDNRLYAMGGLNGKSLYRSCLSLVSFVDISV
jgi:N-acetylneuraminic acid mutarotase